MVSAVILAGGQGKRMAVDGDPTPKPFRRVFGKPMLLILLEKLEVMDLSYIYLVISPENLSYMKQHMVVIDDHLCSWSGMNTEPGLRVPIRILIQETPTGTAKAAEVAARVTEDDLLILNVDCPFVTTHTLDRFLKSPQSNMVAGFKVESEEEATGFGRIYLGHGVEIVEQKDLPRQDLLRERSLVVNVGIYKISQRDLLEAIPKLEVHGTEYYLPEVYAHCEQASVLMVSEEDTLNLNSPQDIERAESSLIWCA